MSRALCVAVGLAAAAAVVGVLLALAGLVIWQSCYGSCCSWGSGIVCTW